MGVEDLMKEVVEQLEKMILSGMRTPGRNFTFSPWELTDSHCSLSYSHTVTSRPFALSNSARAVPHDPPPKMPVVVIALSPS